jgi:hypothetical protein
MSTVLSGDENFANLSQDSQSFMKNEVFGNILANPYKNNNRSEGLKDDYNDVYETYKTIAEEAAKWGNENSVGM